MRNESGFALVIVLIFVSILSEIIISMMHSTLFTSRTLENFAAYYRYIHLANIALQQAKNDILESNTECFNKECPLEGEFLKNHETLTYKIDFLSTAPCFKLKNSEETGADFFKIFVKVGSHSDTAINIQSTFVHTARVSEHCYKMFKIIEPGFLSWRVGE